MAAGGRGPRRAGGGAAAVLLLLLVWGCAVPGRAAVGGGGGRYEPGQEVPLYVNKVGPYHNPQETYHYYRLPVCRPARVRHRSLSLGEVLDGDRMAESLYKIAFRRDHTRQKLCELQLDAAQIEELREAVEELYYFEFVLDDIPIRGFVGYLEESTFLPHTHKVGLWTHLDFHVEYNGDRVIHANVSVRDVKPQSLDELRAPASMTHTYSVRWHETSLPYQRRGERQRDHNFFPRTLEIHWLSIMNSMVLVFLLTGFVLVILMRVLRRDFARYNLEEDGAGGGLLTSSPGQDFEQADNGWKIIHTDVFRFPPHRSLLCSVLGVGAQFLTLGTGIIAMALLGMFNVHRHGAINATAILLYALTCCVSGFVSSNFYRKIGGERWVWNIILTTSLFSAPCFLTWSVINTVHWVNGSTQALPATTVILLLTVWLLVGFPLTVIGGIFGKNRAAGFDAPCRTKNIAREIPLQPWYKGVLVHMTIGGFLPFRNMARVLAGRVCVVTGASRGIGKGIALQLGEAGATVYITGRNMESLRQAAKEVESRGGRCIAVQCDSAKEEQVVALFEQLRREQHGALDILVNNAYSGVKGTLPLLGLCCPDDGGDRKGTNRCRVFDGRSPLRLQCTLRGGQGCDKDILKKSGRVHLTCDLATEYGLRDVDGQAVVQYRSLNFLLKQIPGLAWLGSLLPQFLKVPKWVLALVASHF
ncbi:transmembrane 9 superfamily member 1 isoform X4 [Narcine bancroftii]|uniref:transmembrane 9 superfamily member 1 isoform X4 n=1 Tax=Narcine bancroftii TaxID=1343680 RepID=UPI00383228E4